MMKTLNRLRKIVHSLLYISRIENEQFAKKNTVNIHQLVSEVTDELLHRMEIKAVSFTNNISANVKVTHANRDLLFQLFYNLINNAIRYNKVNGFINITDHYVVGEPYTLYIKDTGIGIRQEELATIFNRFKRSSQADGEGYGLGLSIVKSIALYHGYTINVTSEFGKGTVFSITISGDSLF